MRSSFSLKMAAPWLMLLSRSLLFLFFQAIIAFVLFLAGEPAA